jgi:hypothetical protein
MFTSHSTKSTIGRFAASLKFAVLLVLLGLIVVATERPVLLSPAGAVTTAYQASHVADQARTKAVPEPHALAPAVDDVTYYFPSQFAAPSGPAEELPPQF